MALSTATITMMAMSKKIRTYSELVRFPDIINRFRYLELGGVVGEDTFGFDRYMNQAFYRSREWHNIRNEVIIRDDGCDLGVPGMKIRGHIFVHHMNPMSPDDIKESSDFLLNPEYLICCSFDVHQAIHYGSEQMLHECLGMNNPVERYPNDTCPWR